MDLQGESASEIEVRGDTEPYDAHGAISELCDKAYSIRDLLHDHLQKTKAFEKVVGEFVLRDVAEEDALRSISLDVSRTEMHALRDVRYIAFSQRKTAEQKQQDECANASLPLSDTSISARALHILTSLPDGSPNACFGLSGYRGVSDVLMGWRSLTPASQIQVDLLFQSVMASVPNISSYVLLLNGSLYTPSDSFDRCELSQQEIFDIVGDGGNTSSEGALVGWLNTVVRRSLLTPDLLKKLLSSPDALRESGLCLLGDNCDVLVVVEHTRLLNSVIVRGFVFSGELRAVESVGAQMNLLSALFSSDEMKSQKDIEECVTGVFYQLLEQQRVLACEWRDAVVTLAIQRECIEGKDISSQTLGFVVLDVRPLSPEVPFLWHFTWAEVCALGQLGPLVEGSVSARVKPVFKTVRVALASLEPYDDLSRKMFSLIKGHMLEAKKSSLTTLTVRFAQVAVILAATVLITAGFVAGRVFAGFRRRRA
uniref:WGS project CAEQ00000000 data, annotated contig 1141 n=1 Tax=Trypanosoma congolense (strain IL3000) TaxID=1068625 RepID=F9W432_TRYCI|nr:unnamed protein product [Trypanosoma congolense IL3000]